MSFSNLREGEFVEVTFRAARTGLVKADMIYAQPESVMNESKCLSSMSPQTSPQGSMQATPGDPESVCCCSDQSSMGTGSGALDDVLLTLMRQTLRPEARDGIETNAKLRELIDPSPFTLRSAHGCTTQGIGQAREEELSEWDKKKKK